MVEVGPRDGLQNEAKTVPAPTKIALIERLAAAGLRSVEAGAFVSPKWVPQMADSDKVLAGLKRRPGVGYPVLVPNMKGYERARAAGAEEIAVFAAASETFSQRNTNCSIHESLERIQPVAQAAKRDGVTLRGYVSCVLGCPYEGEVAVAAVIGVAAKLAEMGCAEVSLGDTIGAGTPDKARAMAEAVAAEVGIGSIAVHFHDTYGQALANILACLDAGVMTVDSAVAGLGGCPFAPGAAGNVATEDVLDTLGGLGVETGVDLEKVAEAGRFICDTLGRPPASKVAQALMAKTGRAYS